MANENTYPAPEHGWTCFHCGDTFMHEYHARQHFGNTPDLQTACLVKLNSQDKSLLRALRAAEFRAERLRLDIEFETTSTEVFSGRLQSLLNGYAAFRGCRTVQDVFNVYDTMEGRALAAEEEKARLAALLNTPELMDFAAAVKLEAAHQRERWGSDHDIGKAPSDWLWLLGYLAGKALAAQIAGNTDKALHHTISTAAACANWHASMLGQSDMQPGHAPSAARGSVSDEICERATARG